MSPNSKLNKIIFALSKKQITKPSTQALFVVPVFLFVTTVFGLSILTPGLYTHTRGNNPLVPTASAAPNNTINFQARLLTSTGALVPDGNYHIEFKFYDSLAAGASAQGVCSTNSSSDDCWWRETRTTGNLVAVKNGYISVPLGSVTPFGANIPWDQELWLTMNIGGAGGSASWNGEMSPRMKVTSLPFAQASAKLKGANGLYDADQLAQLGQSTVQTVNSANTAIRINQTGAGSLLQLQASGNDRLLLAANGNLTVAGTGVFQGASVSIGTSSQAGVLTLSDGSSNTTTIQAAATSANLTFTLPAAYGGSGDCIVGNGAGGLSFSATCGSGGSGTAPVGASYLTLGLDGTLTNERVLTAGTNITVSDGGANSTLTINVANSPTFSGTLTVQGATLTVGTNSQQGSLVLNDGSNNTTTLQSAAIAGNLTFKLPSGYGSTGECVIGDGAGGLSFSATCGVGGSGTAPVGASYLTLGLDGTLTSERVLTAGSNISITDGGANGNLTVGLTNTSLTVTAGTGLSGGGSVALGASTTLNLANTTVTANSYGSANSVATFTVDAQGRLTAAGSTSIAINGNQITSGSVAIANGGTGATTSQAAINALSQLTTEGDLLYHNGTNSTRLARGSNGQCLTSNGTTLVWGDCNGSGSGNYIQNTTANQNSSNFNMQSAATTSVTAKFRAIASQTADIIQIRDNTDTTTVFSVAPNGNLTAGTLNGATITGGTLSTTAVNGVTTANIVLTSGSYADPSWITSLAKSKVGLANVENTALSTWAGSSNITTLGTITSGTWQGTAVGLAYGGTGATTAAGARTNLGATTVGGNLFTLTNPSAVTFIRINADNTVSTLDAAAFRTAIGAGTSSTTGTVTSVSGSGGTTGLTLTGGAITTSGTLTLGGTLAVANGGTGATTAQGAINTLSGLTTNGDLLYYDGTNTTRLARGTNGQCLTSNGTTLVWGDCNGSGSGNYIQNTTANQNSSNFNMQSAATTSVTAKFRAIASQTADIIQIRDSADATTVFSVAPNGNLTAGTLNGATITGGTLSTTAVNGVTTANIVLTSGSYADPSWITSLAKSKVGLANVENTALSTWAGSSNITTLGTIASGTWQGSTIGLAYGGTGSTTASGARTNLGATTVGGNLFTLTNPSAVTFIRINADNTVSTLDAASFRTAIGAGTSSTTGTVTSVSGSGGTTGLTLTGGAITTSGTLTLGGTLAVANGGTGATTFTSNGIIYGNAGGTLQVTAASTGANQCLITATAGGAPTWGSCNAGGSGFTSITLSGNTGTNQTINEGDTISVRGDGTVLTSAASATDTVTLSVVADSIGDAQLQYNTGQNLTTTSNVQFANITGSGDLSIQGNTTIGNASSDRVTITSQILGGSPLVFQGVTDNAFTTTFAFADPTVNQTITFPNATGTVCLTSGNCAGVGGTGDILQGGNSFTAAMTIGTNDAYGLNLETSGTTRLSIDSGGATTINGSLAVAGNFTVNTDRFTIDASTGAVNIGSSNTAGTIVLGRSNSASNTINIGNVIGNTYTQTINIGTSSSGTTNTTIGSANAGTTIVQGSTRLSALTTNGFVKTSGGNGALSVSSTVALGSEVSGTLGIGNGGTGATTAANARLNLATSQASTGTNCSTVCLNSIISADTRAVNDTPQQRDAGLYADFKQNSTNGLSDGGTYNGVLNFRPYGTGTDFSGGQTSQLAVTDNGNLWMRTSTNSTTWGTWYQMCSTKAVCSGYAPASGSANYVQAQGTTPGTAQNTNFNIGTGTGIAANLNATTALLLNGNNINTAGTLSNVAYLNQANTFSAANNVFSSGLRVDGNLAVRPAGGAISGGYDALIQVIDSTDFNTRFRGMMAGGSDYFELLGSGTGDNGILEIATGDNGNEPIAFIQRSGGTSYERMRVHSNGYIGIGDSTPSSLLTVGNGDLFQVNSSGAIAATTGITSSGSYTQTGTGANTFSGATTFSATNTALTVTNNASIGGVISAQDLLLSNGGSYSGLNSDTALSQLYGQFDQDVFAFNAPTSYETYNGSTWSGGTVPTTIFTGQPSQSWSGLTIPNGTNRVRFTWNSFGYRFWDALRFVHSTNGNSFRATLQWSTDGTTFNDFYSTPYYSSWPGYSVYKGSNNNSGKTPYLRLIIEPNWSTANAINIGHIGMMSSYGGYNALYTWDYNRNVTFNGVVQATSFTSTVATGTSPLTVSSTTKVTNLNADLLDGLDSTAFAPSTGGSGYVQLQGTTPGTQQTGNFNISGAGILGGNLTIGGSTTASGAVTVKTSSNVQLGLDTNGATQASITFSNAGASKWQVGNQNSGNYNFFIWDTVGGTNVLDAAGNNGTITLGAASRALTLGGNTISVAGNTTVTGSNTFTVGTGATTLGGSLSVASNTILGGQTANGISHFQWEGATYRNPGDFTPTLLVRQDNSSTGTNGFKPALSLYNNDGSQNSTVGLAFVSREENGAGNAVDLAGIMAIKESVGTNNGWSQGGLSFFVKNNGTKIDALNINSAGNVTLTQDLTVSGGDITGANSKSIDLGEQNSSDITFKGTEDAVLRLNGGYTEFIVPDLFQVNNGFYVNGGTSYFNNVMQARGGIQNDLGDLIISDTVETQGITRLGNDVTDSTSIRGLTTISDSSSSYPLRFGSDVDLYRGAADRLDLATGDSLNLVSGSIQQATTTRLTSTGLFQAADGAVGGPAFSFSSDTNSGMYSIAADTLGFSVGGAEKLRVDSNGTAFNGLFRAGGNYYNVVSYNYNGTPTNAVKIKTNIPYTSGSQMPTINIKGYSYGDAAPIDINLVWYIFAGNFANYKASSSGGVTPTIKLANEGGLVTITLEYTPYYARFQVNAFAQGMSETPSWFNGWTIADEAAGATNQVTVAYQNRFGTITGGVWNGSSISDAYLDDNITVSSAGTVAWNALSSYPTACAAGSAISTLGDTPTCTAFALAGSGVTSLNSLAGALSIAGNSQIAVSASSPNINLSIQADSIGDSQLAYNTGQNLTTTSSVAFNDIALSSNINFSSTANKYIRFNSASSWQYYLANSNDDFRVYDSDSTDFMRMYYNGGTTNKYVSMLGALNVKNNGRVGIGTNNPGYKLVVDGDHGNTQFLMHSSGDGGATNTADLMLWASEPGHTYTGVGIANNLYNTTGFPRINTNRGGSLMRLLDNSIEFTTVNSSGTQLTGMTLNGSGNLTIAGTATTGGTLRVNGSGILNSSGYEVLQTNATDWLRINQNNSFTSGTAAYGNWAFGTGGISVGSWGTAGAGNIQASGNITGSQLISTVSTGTAPLTVSSTTVVTNLNADYLDGYHASSFALTSGVVQLAPASAQTDSSTNSSIFINKTGASGNLLTLQKGASNVLTVGNTGATTFKNTADSSSAFQIQNAAGANVLNIDTSTNTVSIRSSATTNNYAQDFNGSFLPAGWTTGGNANWTQDSTIKQEGASSANTGVISDNQSSWIDYDYTAPTAGYLSFYWKVSSEGSYDYLNFCLDNDSCSLTGGYYTRISGTVDWVYVRIPVSSGLHSFRWLYAKDPASVGGTDEGWIDNITFDSGIGTDSFTIKNNAQTSNYFSVDSYGNSTFRSSNSFKIQNSVGISVLNVDTSIGSVVIQSPTDNATAFSVQKQNGISVFNVDTANQQLSLRNKTDISSVGSDIFGADNNTCSGTGWTDIGTNVWSHTPGTAQSLVCTSPASVTAGVTYEITYSDTLGGAGTPAIYMGGGNAALQQNVTNAKAYITTTNTSGISMTASLAHSGSLTIHSVKIINFNTSAFALKSSDGTVNLEIRTGYGGANNIGIGLNALRSTGYSIKNIAIGNNTGANLSSGNSNIFIGHSIDAQSSTGSNQLSIGNLIFGGGGFGEGLTVGTGRIGIGGIEDGTDKLRVYGDIKVGTSGTNGCVKRYDGAALTGTCASDERFKEDITTMDGVLDKVANLQAVTYKFNQFGKDYTGATGNEIQYGLIAQQVLQVAPELVSTDENGYLKLRYDLLPIYAIAAIGEQQAMISDAQSRLAALENSIQPSSNNILDLTNGGTIQGNLNVVGNLNVTGPVTISSLTVTDDVVIAGNLTVQNISVANITINGHIITAGNTPTTTIGTAAGTEDQQNNIPAPQVTIEGNDTSGTITIVAGANTATGTLVEVNFDKQFTKTPKVVLTAGNEKTSEIRFFRSAETGKFLINLKDAPQANQTYQFDYFVVE